GLFLVTEVVAPLRLWVIDIPILSPSVELMEERSICANIIPRVDLCWALRSGSFHTHRRLCNERSFSPRSSTAVRPSAHRAPGQTVPLGRIGQVEPRPARQVLGS